jgi:hypothetical protein
VEFKSSLRWDYNLQKLNPVLEKQVVKAVVGFLNSDTGGNLVIGMDDQKQVLGLEPDYSTLNTRPNRDGFEQKLQQVLFAAIGERCCARWLKISFCSLHGKDLCVVKISPASEAIYPRDKDSQDTLYVRIGNTTRPLNAREAVAFAADRWNVQILRRLNRRAGTKVSAARVSEVVRQWSILRIAQRPAIGAISLVAPENPQRSGLCWPTTACRRG